LNHSSRIPPPFGDRVSLCSPGWPQIPDSHASASWALGLQVCITTLDSVIILTNVFWWICIHVSTEYIGRFSSGVHLCNLSPWDCIRYNFEKQLYIMCAQTKGKCQC
jgi:hypothetical protein